MPFEKGNDKGKDTQFSSTNQTKKNVYIYCRALIFRGFGEL